MKILFINPPFPKMTMGFKGLMTLEPMSLEYMGAILTEHDVNILDMVIDSDVEKAISTLKPDIVCISAFYVHKYVVFDLAERIKRYNSSIFTILGGSYAFYYPQENFNENLDLVVSSDDMFTIAEIARNFPKRTFENIPNIHFKKGNEGWISTKKVQYAMSIEDYPFPNRSLTQKYRKNYHWYYQNKVASVWGSVGCPYKCYYCTQWARNNGKFMARSAKSLVDEIATIDEEYVFIIDDNTFTDRNRALEIYEYIKRSNIHKKYMCYCSPNLIIKNEDILRKWKEIGLVQIMTGFESFRAKDLNDIENKTSLETNKKAIEIVQDIGIDTMAGFIIYPDFTEQDFKDLNRFIKENKLYYAEFTPLTPFPGTKFYDENLDVIGTPPPDFFDMQHMVFPTQIPLKRFYYRLAWLYLMTHLPHRALRAKLTMKASKNPFSKININFIRLLKGIITAYKNH